MNEKEKKPSAKEQLTQACQSSHHLFAYLEAKARAHRHYKRYTTHANLNNWINEQGLFLSVGTRWNDVEDRERFIASNQTGTNFGVCFTYSKSENVAMWMLYGGLQKTGAMIDYAEAELRHLIDTIQEIEVGRWQNGKFVSTETLHREEFSVVFTDMLYCSSAESDKCTVKRSDARVENVSMEIIELLDWRRKAYPWCYENECRLVISVKRKLDDSITDACIRAAKLYQKTLQNGRVYCAPNSTQTGFRPSQLKARIEWELCNNKCKKSFKVKRRVTRGKMHIA